MALGRGRLFVCGPGRRPAVGYRIGHVHFGPGDVVGRLALFAVDLSVVLEADIDPLLGAAPVHHGLG